MKLESSEYKLARCYSVKVIGNLLNEFMIMSQRHNVFVTHFGLLFFVRLNLACVALFIEKIRALQMTR